VDSRSSRLLGSVRHRDRVLDADLWQRLVASISVIFPAVHRH